MTSSRHQARRYRDSVDFAAAIRSLRRHAGLTQAELGDRLHLARQVVGQIESGKHRPTISTRVRILRAVWTDLADYDDRSPIGAEAW